MTGRLEHGQSGNPARGRPRAPEYRAWSHIKTRCYNTKSPDFPNYGGRGIRVADEWLNDFPAFLAHIGPRPSPAHSIERIRNDGDYAPGNVRWATRSEQNCNKRNLTYIVLDGEVMCLAEACRKVGLRPNTVRMRISSCGYSLSKALGREAAYFSN